MSSLQEQLLKAGLVDRKKVNQVNKEKQKKAKAGRRGQGGNEDRARQAAKQEQAKKFERDRELNRQKQLNANSKAVRAQILQLIKMNKIDREGGEIAYSFVDGKKIRKIYVTEALQKQLVAGRLGIARYQRDGILAFDLVPAAIAEKIAERDGKSVIMQQSSPDPADQADDPYADYKIPDDLLW